MLKPLRETISDCIFDLADKDYHAIQKIIGKLNKIENYEIFMERAEMYVEHIGFSTLGMFEDYCE